MELGFMVEPQTGGSYHRLLELSRWAEDVGFTAFARSDHYLDLDESQHATDALTTLAGLARETSTIQLLPLVSPLTFHHPSRLAKVAATLDEMSGGRFALGVGTGWMESEHEAFGIDLPELRERFSRLFETLSYLRAAFDGSEGFSGRHYRLAAIDVLPRPQTLPIVIGGSGMRKTPSIAGRFADEYNMFGCDRETLELRLDVMRQAAEEAGRDPASVRISFSCPVHVAATEPEYVALIERRAAEAGRSPDEYEEIQRRRNYVIGTPGQAAEVMHRIADMGIDRLYLQRYAPLDEIDTGIVEAIVAAYRA